MRYRVPLSFRPFLRALAALTPVRGPLRGDPSAEELRAATAFYPLVGLLVGAAPAAVLLLPLPPLPLGTLALVAWVLAAGALPLRGWARCCDAAFASAAGDAQATRERRGAILADPRLGTFGGVGLGLLLLAKWTGLVYAPVVAPLLAAPVARWAMVHALRSYPAARPDGIAAALAGDGRLWTATAVLMGIALPLIARADDPLRVAGAVIVAVGAALAVAELLTRRLGGVTDDVCGAVGEAAELAALWVFLPWGYA